MKTLYLLLFASTVLASSALFSMEKQTQRKQKHTERIERNPIYHTSTWNIQALALIKQYHQTKTQATCHDKAVKYILRGIELKEENRSYHYDIWTDQYDMALHLLLNNYLKYAPSSIEKDTLVSLADRDRIYDEIELEQAFEKQLQIS